MGFEISSAWSLNTEIVSSMASILPQTNFGPQLKHSKVVDIVMGDIDSLSTYPNYCKSGLVPHLLIGKTDRPAQPAQGRTFHQEGFCHSDLGGSMLTPPNMILNLSPYAEIPKQPWNPMLASVNPVYSEVTKSQPAQPEKPDDWVYGLKAAVWPYGLLFAGHMVTKVQVPCVYKYPPWSFDKLPSMSWLHYGIYLCFCRKSWRNLIKILVGSIFHQCQVKKNS